MRKRKWLSPLLAAVLAAVQAATLVPVTAYAAEVPAVEEQGEQRAVVETWRQFKSSTSNDNGGNAAILVNTNEGTVGMEAGEFSFVLKPNGSQTTTRFNVGPYITDNDHYMTIGYNATGWFYEYKGAGNNYPAISSLPTPPQAGQEMPVTIRWDSTAYTVTAGDSTAEFQIPDEAFEGLKSGKLGFRIGSWNNTEITDIYFNNVVIKDGEGNVIVENGADTWELQTTDSGEVYNEEIRIAKVTVNGRVVDTEGGPVENAEVALGTAVTKTDADGAYTFTDIAGGTYTIAASKSGYQSGTTEITVGEDDVTVEDIVLTEGSSVVFEGDDIISSDEMEVAISNTFPQAVGYTMKGGEDDGKKFYGQTAELTQLKVNGELVTPEVEYQKESESKAVYTMKIDEKDIEATVTAAFEVKENTLSFDITKIDAEEGTFFTVEIPNHNLVTVKASQSGAYFAGANMQNNTAVSGDTYASVSAQAEGKYGYMYAFVSSDELSAGLWSNSENHITTNWQRVTAVTDTVGGIKETGLSSTYWTYQKGPEYRIENRDYEMPSTKVVITGDENGDDRIDWQDGAIAYRTIMNNPVGCELVPDRVAIRIAMNFNSHAQNPFLMTYDNAQKVYLNTDGLGQSILLKGYGSEGHDSGHLNYADVGRRIGGVEDMKKLLAQGKEIGATFGIHVNASETYPESPYFEEDRLMKKSDGVTLDYGWNWLDQGINIDADYDLKNGREQRFVDLWEALGGEDNDLDFIYIDVWGNGQSGDNGTWASRQLAKEITQTCGWRLGGEWGHANEYDSTFQHWATDLTYGGADSQGLNSVIARFIRNHQKDSWVGSYPSYGGAAVEPLLGGYDMKDFEGWKGRNDYQEYITNLFDDNISTKFLQHYQVMKWENGEPTIAGGVPWIPEKRITLQDEERANTIVVERKSTDGASPEYMERIMTLNGRKILDGETYLIPWFWDFNGNDLADKDQKLYHWNQQGGTTTWELPEGWDGADIYELTETGNVKCNDIAVISGNQITIKAEASVPYVLHKSDYGEGIQIEELTWSKGAHIVDTGFNSNTLQWWDVKGDGAEITRSAASNLMLSMGSETEEVSLTQTVTDLVPGRGYAAYVGVDNRSDAKAYIEVSVDGKVISNYTERSIARNYLQPYAHNNNQATTEGTGSYFQNMFVFFTAPEEGGEVTLTLRREAGEGKTYFDDVRIVHNMFGETETENQFNPFESETTLNQTFEAVPQGIFPFVIGNLEGVNDNRTHLSELHAPYTQAGWYGVKMLDDVLDGTWSLKTNGLTARNNLVYQTIPQNYRFEEGEMYHISFQYEMGSENTYAFAVGNGEYDRDNIQLYEMPATDLADAEPQTFKFRLAGQPGDQFWIGIYSTTTPADTREVFGDEAEFGGYKDFILDNLVIEKSVAKKIALDELVIANSGRYEVNYTPETWAVFADAMGTANAVLDDPSAPQDKVDAAEEELKKAVDGLEVIAVTLYGTVTDEEGNPAPDVSICADNGVEAFTDAQGAYVLPGAVFGERIITADSDIFGEVHKEITVSEEELEVELNFTVAPELTRVEGTVTAVGEPVEGAVVTVGNQTEVTDKNGFYAFDQVLTKVYSVTFEKEGYDSVSKDVRVVKDKTNVVNAMLPPLTRDEPDYENDYENGDATWANLAGNGASTTITAEGGETKIIFPGQQTNVYETKAPAFKNGVVEMDVRAAREGTRIGLLLRAQNMDNRVYVGVGDSPNLYFAEYWGKAGNTWSDMYQGETFEGSKTMHLKAEIVNNRVALWVNGTQMFDITMEGMPMEAGYIGLNTRESHTVYVDNVKVTSYDLPTDGKKNVAGRVVDINDKPIENAKVELLDMNEEQLYATTTDALGNYKFKNILAGEYFVRVTSGDIVKVIPLTVTGEEEDYVVVDKAVMSDEVDKSELQALIQYAKAQQETEDYQYVVPAVKKLFEAKLAEAEAVNAKEDASQEEIDAAYDALLDMVQKLSYIGNSEELKVLVDVVKGMDLEGVYTAETVKAVQEALAAAETVLANENALQEEIDAARDALQSAVDQLERIPVDKSKLEKLVADAAEYESRIGEYTPATAEPFTAALEGARAVLADDGAVQEEVDSAYATLQNAIFGLREIPDKSKLEELIKEAEGLDLSGYTAQSVEKFRAALASAKLVMADPNAEEADVTRAAEQLQAAMDGLEKTEEKPGEEPDTKPGEKPDGNGGTDGKGSTDETAVQTGDSAPIALYVILVMITAGAAVVCMVRLRKRHKK